MTTADFLYLLDIEQLLAQGKITFPVDQADLRQVSFNTKRVPPQWQFKKVENWITNYKRVATLELAMIEIHVNVSRTGTVKRWQFQQCEIARGIDQQEYWKTFVRETVDVLKGQKIQQYTEMLSKTTAEKPSLMSLPEDWPQPCDWLGMPMLVWVFPHWDDDAQGTAARRAEPGNDPKRRCGNGEPASAWQSQSAQWWEPRLRTRRRRSSDSDSSDCHWQHPTSRRGSVADGGRDNRRRRLV
jgi:hypothetical protein